MGVESSGVKRGDIFEFDDVPGPKGMQAKKLKKLEQAMALQLSGGHIVRREVAPKHGSVILSVEAKSPFFKDPQECRDALIEGAKAVGCNAVLGLVVKRETWSKGNYRHTMHWANGNLCLVAEPRQCNPADRDKLKASLEETVAAVASQAKALVDRFNSRRFWQKFPWGLIVIVLIVIGFVVAANS